MSQSKYMNDEQKRLNLVLSQIKLKEVEVNKINTRDKDFSLKYRELNEMRIKRNTIQSRIDNFGKDNQALSDHTIPKVINK